MRVRPESLLIAAMSIFALAGMTAIVAQNVREARMSDPVVPVFVEPVVIEPASGTAVVEPSPVAQIDPEDAREWFRSIRQFCNPVEVETRLRWQPAPGSEQGVMHEAACYALAGKVDLARSSIERLPADRRYHAAGVVFEAGHPAADAGDEIAAGPLMELVVEFWPNHYMALYHAGSSRYQSGDYEAAQRYLTRFLEEYTVEDGWRSSAQSMLETIGG